MKSEIVLFRKVVLVAIVVGVAVAAIGCPSEQYFSDQRGNGGATSTAATTGGTGGSVPCSATMPCADDSNPCTAEACTNGFCTRTALNEPMGPESTACMTVACVDGATTPPVIHETAACGNGLKCNALGQCVGCKDLTTCPAPPDCQTVSCVAMVCTPGSAPEGTPSVKVVNSPKDCKKPVCDGKGGIEFADDDLDLPIDDLNSCTDRACVAGTPAYPPSAAGKACTSPDSNAKVCDGNGACVECAAAADCTAGAMPSCDMTTHKCISCSDGLQNGSETGKDCGGICSKCNGDPCVPGDKCKSTVCADKVCCDADCSGSCVACDLPGKAGECSAVAKGLEDSACNGGMNQPFQGHQPCRSI